MNLLIANRAQYFRGLGDAVTLAWLAEGFRAPEPCRIAFHEPDPKLAAVLTLFGQWVVDGQKAAEPCRVVKNLNPAYQRELADRGRRLRLEYLCDHLAIEHRWARPEVRLSDESLAWAEEEGFSEDGRLRVLNPEPRTLNPIVMFPQVAWQARAWPANYFVDLAWQLAGAGHRVVTLLDRNDGRFTNTPKWYFGLPLDRVAAAVSRASLVIGNDSFGVHLAGTLNVPTLALMGPTRAQCVFGHMGGFRVQGSGFRVQGSGFSENRKEPTAPVPEPRTLNPEPSFVALSGRSPNCAGCHFGAPFRAACDQGCESLMGLRPETVREAALELLASREGSAI